MTKYQQVGLAREKKSKPGEKRAYIKTDNVTGTSTDHQTKNMEGWVTYGLYGTSSGIISGNRYF